MTQYMDYDVMIHKLEKLELFNKKYGEIDDFVFTLDEFICFPPNIKKLLQEDLSYFKTIINFYKNKTEYYIVKNVLFDKMNTPKKLKYILFSKDIIPWLKTTEFFKNFKLDINEIKNLRKWQIEALNIIKDKGYMNGIFNVIMGAGKSLFELLLIEYHFRNILTQSEQQNATYIIVSSRKSILNGIFNFNENMKDKFDKYKKLNQFNIDNFDNVIDLVNNKNLKKETKTMTDNTSNLVIINIQFLNSLMKEVNKKFFTKLIKNLKLIIFDECHNISAKRVFDFFKLIKQLNIPIIGLSATPMRTALQARKKTNEIFSIDNKNVNIIYTFDLFQGIKTNTILPFKINKYKFKGKILVNKIDDDEIYDDDETCNTENNIKDKQGFVEIEYNESDIKYNRNLVKNILENEIRYLPYRKGIGFCKDINSANEWKIYLSENVKDMRIYITHSGNKDIVEEDQYIDFKKLIPNNNMINSFLIAVGRCSEGCDIEFIDFAICLDPVKNTDIVVMLQKFGRISRVDNEDIEKRKKTHALIFDTYIEDGNKIDFTINSIIVYYNSLLQNIDKASTYYKKNIYELYKNTDININNNVSIRIKIDNDINHDTILWWDKVEDNSFEKLTNEFKYKFKNKIKDIICDDTIFINNKIEEYITIKINNEIDYNNCMFLIKDNNFAFSKIKDVFINNVNIKVVSYKQIINSIYREINNVDKILEHTKMSIVQYEKNTSGYKYNKELNISIQGVDANTAILEIVRQCFYNTISCCITIELKDNTMINI